MWCKTVSFPFISLHSEYTMEPSEVQQLIQQGLTGAQVTVTGDGSHFEAIVVGDLFEGKMPVKRQQLVYGALGDRITSGAIHAISIKAYTPSEWEQARKLKIS
jgi:acid stress-induced BolA-like protein IbaG/YrbA